MSDNRWKCEIQKVKVESEQITRGKKLWLKRRLHRLTLNYRYRRSEMTKGFQNPESTLTCYFFKKEEEESTKKPAFLLLWPFTSPNYHTGAYLNQQTAFSHPLRPVVTYAHKLAHTNTRPHSPRAPTFTLTQGDTPSLLKIHNHHSLCKIHTHHVLSAWVHFINAHTLLPTHIHSHRLVHTHFTEGPLALLPLYLTGAICFTLFICLRLLMKASSPVVKDLCDHLRFKQNVS